MFQKLPCPLKLVGDVFDVGFHHLVEGGAPADRVADLQDDPQVDLQLIPWDVAVVAFRSCAFKGGPAAPTVETKDGLDNGFPFFEVWVKNVGKHTCPAGEPMKIEFQPARGFKPSSLFAKPLFLRKWSLPAIKPGETRKFIVPSIYLQKNYMPLMKNWEILKASTWEATYTPTRRGTDANPQNNTLVRTGLELEKTFSSLESTNGYTVLPYEE